MVLRLGVCANRMMSTQFLRQLGDIKYQSIWQVFSKKSVQLLSKTVPRAQMKRICDKPKATMTSPSNQNCLTSTTRQTTTISDALTTMTRACTEKISSNSPVNLEFGKGTDER